MSSQQHNSFQKSRGFGKLDQTKPRELHASPHCVWEKSLPCQNWLSSDAEARRQADKRETY